MSEEEKTRQLLSATAYAIQRSAENRQATIDELQALHAENARLREALNVLLEITDKCKTMQIGAGGMSIEAQSARTVYLRVPIWPFEEARAALAGEMEP